MLSYQTKTFVNRPVKEVYADIMNIDKVPLWLTGLQKLEPISGTPGEVGFKSRYTFVENGRTAVFEEVITAVEPRQFFSFLLESKEFQIEVTTQLEAQGQGTQIIVSNKVKAKSLMMKLMSPFLKGMMKKRQQEDFARFKALVEGEKK